MAKRQIIGFGGALLRPRENRALERYALAATGVARPKICFLGTAGGDDARDRGRFYETFGALDCMRAHLPLFARAPADIRAFLLAHDALFVGGGNTRSMLGLWREWGVDAALREAWEAGVVLAGESAGMLCWFRRCVTDSTVGAPAPIAGLGLLPYDAAPHFSSEPGRRAALRDLVGRSDGGEGFGVDDRVGVHFIDAELVAVVTADPHATAYRLRRRDGAVEETRLSATPLPRVRARGYDLRQRAINAKHRLRGWERTYAP